MSGDYTPGTVTKVLAHCFDPYHGWGFPTDDRPRVDPSMPKAQGNPATHGLAWAMCADVQSAFKRLTPVSKRVVWDRYVLGKDYEQIMGSSEAARDYVERVAFKAVRRMCEDLNGHKMRDKFMKEEMRRIDH
ncbi:hypothetical protein [Schaalia sp. ZJ1691]|uniref:hypothetical protein n=1 Tax=Schaalia sp. ZJ1691 TaxID=2709404 RepID=UPI0013ED26B1|nr:hypothetical protein [Schaalia sp. ZJ1691]